jgi:hypothetical protein
VYVFRRRSIYDRTISKLDIKSNYLPGIVQTQSRMRPELHWLGQCSKKFLCANLGTNVFDYGQKSAADQMHTSWEKLAQFVGTNYGQDISNELQNHITVILIDPVHTDDMHLRHSLRETMICNSHMNIQRARKAQETILEAAVHAGLDMEAPMKLSLLQNEIAQGEFSANVEVPILLNDSQNK